MIKTAADLWDSLEKGAGLEVRRGRHKKPGRDYDLEIALKAVIDISGDPRPLVHCLKDPASPASKVSTEDFLIALLESQRGFGAMLKELLEMLESANAGRDDETIDVQFHFDDASTPLRLTLESFQKTVERTERILVSRYEIPGHDNLWGIWRELRDLSRDPPNRLPRNEMLQAAAAPSRSGKSDVDERIASLHGLVEDFVTFCRRHGKSRKETYHSLRTQTGNTEQVLRASTDFWDLSVLESLDEIAQLTLREEADAGVVAQRLDALLARIERKDHWEERTYQELLDLLALPLWHRRHELYSVWIGSVLLRTARAHANAFQFHVDDGALSFAFSGNKLATYDLNGGRFDIWAELRSDLVGKSRKRLKKIQPDFRVLLSDGNVEQNKATTLVLECKHYLVQSTANFSMAAEDYARSCPEADVLVVNHGPLDSAGLLSSLDAGLRAKTAFLGEITVETELQSKLLETALQQRLFPRAPSQAPTHTRPVVASFSLRWDASLSDIDLSVEVHRGESVVRINYAFPGDLAVVPFVSLERDCRHGPGEETIRIASWDAERYVFYATNYSMTGALGGGNLVCGVSLDGSSWTLSCPPLGTASRWKIAEIHVIDGVALLTG